MSFTSCSLSHLIYLMMLASCLILNEEIKLIWTIFLVTLRNNVFELYRFGCGPCKYLKESTRMIIVRYLYFIDRNFQQLYSHIFDPYNLNKWFADICNEISKTWQTLALKFLRQIHMKMEKRIVIKKKKEKRTNKFNKMTIMPSIFLSLIWWSIQFHKTKMHGLITKPRRLVISRRCRCHAEAKKDITLSSIPLPVLGFQIFGVSEGN